MKYFLILSSLFIVIFCINLQAEDQKYGVLNVFTDLPEAIIYVDSLEAGQETIVKLPLPVGEHYVQVKLKGKLVYAEKVVLKDNRSTTVVSEHFVDIITKTPSRGAIDREAARLRESRGNLALGVSFATNSPQPVASVKWWALDRIGIQMMLSGNLPNQNFGSLIGGRLFISPADKIFLDDILTGYLFLGAGLFQDRNTSLTQDFLEVGIAIEARIGEIANSLFKAKYHHRPVKKKEKDFFTQDLMLLTILNLTYTSFEITMIKESNAVTTTRFNIGFHVYF